MKPFIDFHTQNWARKQHEFEKAYAKIMNNSVFGKCKENAKTCEVDHQKKIALKCFSKNTFKGARYIDVLNMVGFYSRRSNIINLYMVERAFSTSRS